MTKTNEVQIGDIIYEEDGHCVYDIEINPRLRKHALLWWDGKELSLERYRELLEFTNPFDVPYTEEQVVAMFIGEAILNFMGEQDE